MPNRNWQTPYLQYLHRGELPLNRAEARWLARRAKSFVLTGDEKELANSQGEVYINTWNTRQLRRFYP
jgi:hypothetical protein